jgi:AcrR family transcriptional regulator
MRERLLATGTRLLAAGGFDAVSIAQIAAEAGCSVGAFYQRFRNKEAYFEFLLDRVIDQVRAQTLVALAPERTAGLNQAQTIALCVRHHIWVVREHEGLIRAALGYSMHGSDDWQPIGEIGAWLNAHYIGLILHTCRPRDAARLDAARRQLRIGLQIITGHLINAVAHEPALLHLNDPDLPYWLSSVVSGCLAAKPPEAQAPAQPASKAAVRPDTPARPARKRPPG